MNPTTAKEILKKLEQDFDFIHNGCPFPPGPWIGYEYKEQLQRFIVEAMRAAVEAVRPIGNNQMNDVAVDVAQEKRVAFLSGISWAIEKIDSNTRHFFTNISYDQEAIDEITDETGRIIERRQV